MLVVGVDPSLTGTGVARQDAPPTVLHTKLRGPARLAYLRDALEALVLDADLVVLEGYSYGSKNNREVLGEWGGVLRVMLWERGVPYAVVAPTTLKKFAVSNGGADKNLMLAEAIRVLGYQGHNSDEADALWLMTMGIVHLGGLGPALNRKQRAALEEVTWP